MEKLSLNMKKKTSAATSVDSTPSSSGGRRRRTRRLPMIQMLQAYKQANPNVAHNRVLVLDYDGLLANRDVVPELSRPSPFVTSYLVQLASNSSNLLVVLSGRSRSVLEAWLTTPDGNPIDCAIGAENGVFFRQNPSSNWENMGLVKDAETWKSQVLPIMQFFSERTPGTCVFVCVFSFFFPRFLMQHFFLLFLVLFLLFLLFRFSRRN